MGYVFNNYKCHASIKNRKVLDIFFLQGAIIQDTVCNMWVILNVDFKRVHQRTVV